MGTLHQIRDHSQFPACENCRHRFYPTSETFERLPATAEMVRPEGEPHCRGFVFDEGSETNPTCQEVLHVHNCCPEFCPRVPRR